MSGFNQGFILGNVLADQRNSKNINDLNDAKNTIAIQSQKMNLFKESLKSAGIVYNATISNEFNKSNIAILDSDSDINKRYLYIYRTKKSFGGWVNLQYDDKAGKFDYLEEKKSGKITKFTLDTNKKYDVYLKPDLTFKYNDHYNYDGKKFPIKCILWSLYGHDTFETPPDVKDKSGKLIRKIIPGPNLVKMFNEGKLYPENIIYIN